MALKFVRSPVDQKLIVSAAINSKYLVYKECGCHDDAECVDIDTVLCEISNWIKIREMKYPPASERWIFSSACLMR